MDIQALVKNYCDASGQAMAPDKAGQFDLVIDSDYRVRIRPDQHHWALFIGSMANKNLSPEAFFPASLEKMLKRNVATLRKRKDFIFFDSKTNEIRLAYRLYLKNLSKTAFIIELNRFIERLKEWILAIETSGAMPSPSPMQGMHSAFFTDKAKK